MNYQILFFVIVASFLSGCAQDSDPKTSEQSDPPSVTDDPTDPTTTGDLSDPSESADASDAADITDAGDVSGSDACIEDHWNCPLEPGYAEGSPEPTFDMTEGLDPDGTLEARFWDAYEFAESYFGIYGPVHIYILGPTSSDSNEAIFRLRAERRAVAEACYSVENQIDDFLTHNAPGELEAANNGTELMAGISGNTPCNPLFDFTLINIGLDLNALEPIVLHEYTHVHQVAHQLSWDRSGDLGLNSWMLEGQATYFAAKFSPEQGWGPSYVDQMVSIKRGIDEFLEESPEFALNDESYWETDMNRAGMVYYQIGAWAWAYLIHSIDGDIETALKSFIRAIPQDGKAASFERYFGMTLEDFYAEFDVFIRRSLDETQAILE